MVLEEEGHQSYLRVGEAAWRLRIDVAIADGSVDETSEAVNTLVEASIERLSIDTPISDTVLGFGDLGQIEILETAAAHPSWYWFGRDRTCLSVGPGSEYSQRELGDDDLLIGLANEGLGEVGGD